MMTVWRSAVTQVSDRIDDLGAPEEDAVTDKSSNLAVSSTVSFAPVFLPFGRLTHCHIAHNACPGIC